VETIDESQFLMLLGAAEIVSLKPRTVFFKKKYDFGNVLESLI
jgi:hypothetical protein